ncbi:hypothetical protein SAMN02745134_02051 [Clostridium acidisoli DSM 12555]|uniref:LAGLIDADG endonuclease n=1 Tax=Clostridium acidisoli DSM 12555 TaxID=1121291 RepID=A0A1W1XJ27_9CLOT|nr:hypothetical protein SAMN02745134_02051 [Clostridium acidisoli DSM 12555]
MVKLLLYIQIMLGCDVILTKEEKAYIAGIVDGEGSIMLLKFHKNQFPAPCISIASTTMELLDWIKLKTGMGTIKHKKNYNLERHRECFTYVVKYNDAITLLSAIEAYLVIETKRKRAKFILNGYKNVTPRNGRYSLEKLEAKQMFYEEFMKLH